MRAAVVSADSTTLEILIRALVGRLGLKIAWTSEDRACALDQSKIDPPDLLIVDISSEGLDGLKLIEGTAGSFHVLAVFDPDRDLSAVIYDAMGRGALDAARIPRLEKAGKLAGERDFLEKVETLARLGGAHLKRSPSSKRLDRPKTDSVPILVVIGSSTGGPQVLATILAPMVKDLPAAFVVVQHLDERFAADLAAWLDPQTSLDVRLALPGVTPKQGVVLVADPTAHLVAHGDGTLGYEGDRKDLPYKPSIDRFFHSLADHQFRPGVAVLLSGMGRDGAAGLLRLRDLGWRTIAQDASTSAVYGMPKVAAELHAAEQILPDFQIADAVEAAVESLSF